MIIALIVSLFFIPVRLRLLVDFDIIKKLFSFSFANYASSFFGRAPNLILPLIITNLIGAETTAYFYVAWMVAGLLYIIPDAISVPLISESSHSERDLKKNVKKAFKFIFILLIPCIIMVLIAGKYLLLLFGQAYSDHGFRLLQILALSSIPTSVNILYLAMKNVQHKIKTVVMINFLRALGVLILSSLLVRYGLVWIGVGWLMTQSIIAFFIICKFIQKGELE